MFDMFDLGLPSRCKEHYYNFCVFPKPPHPRDGEILDRIEMRELCGLAVNRDVEAQARLRAQIDLIVEIRSHKAKKAFEFIKCYGDFDDFYESGPLEPLFEHLSQEAWRWYRGF